MTLPALERPAPVQHLSTLRLARIRDTESTWGREGLWCSACRRSTPVEQLQVVPAALSVRCEGCAGVLLAQPRARRRAHRVH